MLVSEPTRTDSSKFGDRPGSRFDSSRRTIKRARSSSTSIALSAQRRIPEEISPTPLHSPLANDQRYENHRSCASTENSSTPNQSHVVRPLKPPKNKKARKSPKHEPDAPHAAVRDRPPSKKACRKPQIHHNLNDETSQLADHLDRRSTSTSHFLAGPRLCPAIPSHISIFNSIPNAVNPPNMDGGMDNKRIRSPGGLRIGRPERLSRHHSTNLFPTSPSLAGKISSPQSVSSPGSSLLQEIGACEILDQDDRPTFVIDLQNRANFEPGPLHILFPNAILRASFDTLSMVSGKGVQSLQSLSASSEFNEFKAWAISYVRNLEPLDVPLPSFRYLGATWSCNTLRRRLRIFRGAFSPSSTTFSRGSPTNSDLSSFRRDTRVRTPGSAFREGSMIIDEEEGDYFGKSHSFRTHKADGTDKSTSSRDSSPDSSVLTCDKRPAMAEGDSTRKLPFRQASKEKVLQPMAQDNEAILRAVAAKKIDHLNMPSQRGFFDWTRLPVTPALPRHIQFARSVDWGSTSLGPIETWCDDLRSMCNLVMANPHPAAMYWGDDLIAIYNEPYILLARQKHPQLMGQPYQEAWPEIWDSVEGVFADAKISGQSTMKDDDCLFMNRAMTDGFLEETFFSWSIIPLIGADGSVVGLYNPAFEKTRRKLAERRMLTLRELGEKTASSGDLQCFWDQVLGALASNPYDVPFVLIYSAIDQTITSDSSSSSIASNASGMCRLKGALGLTDAHVLVPETVDVESGPDYLARTFRESSELDNPAFLRVDNGSLDAALVEGMEPRGYPDPCKAAVCFPVHATSGDKVLGYVLMGINPRRPYDDDYSLFVQILSRQLATTMASVMLFVEEINKGKRAAKRAAADKIQLAAQLADQRQQAQESEARFARMAEVAPVGIFIANPHGQLTYSNDTWHDISHVPKGAQGLSHWMNGIKAEDRPVFESNWRKLVEHKTPFKNVEFRFDTSWKDSNGNKSDTWVLASAYPEKDGEGNLKIIFGSLTNISQQKRAELIEKRHAEEARESKRQQENFIDITSHEMRNPLSAILQSADDISVSLTKFSAAHGELPSTIAELFENSIDCAQTITLCAQHQKRIVDDILTLSKLDSALLLVTPCDVSPVATVHRALRMFDGELQTAGIELQFKVDHSLTDLHVASIKLDPSRLLQVLINLITNAIKFTSSQTKKYIAVTIGASLVRPARDLPTGVQYFPSRAKRKDLTDSDEWGTGEKVYMHFAVQDTGRGLTEDETKLLFIRFSQTSPRTHVKYGGSGLGLFISRELVELQGGEIGVRSTAGEGSTFAFYVTARRSSNPPEDMEYVSSMGLMEGQERGTAMHVDTISSGKAKRLPPLSRSPSHGDRPPLSILIVEDNLVNQRVLQKQLRSKGFNVLVANHGVECLEMLRMSSFVHPSAHGNLQVQLDHSADFDVVLMDLEMPVMDGMTCTREIRRLEERGEIIRHVPIIAVTANARVEQIQGAKDGGMVSLLTLLPPFRLSPSFTTPS